VAHSLVAGLSHSFGLFTLTSCWLQVSIAIVVKLHGGGGGGAAMARGLAECDVMEGSIQTLSGLIVQSRCRMAVHFQTECT